MLESDLKLAVEQYLQYKQNAGELVFLRLNTGDFIEVRGNTRRRVKGCPKGTSDFMVIQQAPWPPYTPLCSFIELKSDKGKQRLEQGAFQKLVEAQGAEYYIVRSVEELEELL